MFILIVAILTLPIWLVPFGPIVWIAGLVLALAGRSGRIASRTAAHIADRQSAEMRAVLRATNPEAALALETADRAAFKRDSRIFWAVVGIIILIAMVVANHS